MHKETTKEIILPAALTKQLLVWYDSGHRELPWRENPSPYYVWVSEIMLQQTRVEAVKPYFSRFMKALPNIAALAAAEEEVLLKLWEGLGYYRRVFQMQRAAVIIMERYGGRMPQSYAELLCLPGIGEYTAGAIASIAFHQPVPAVDGNVLRVLARVTGEEREIQLAQVKKDFFFALKKIYPQKRCGDFTQSLMELGAVVCLPNGMPKCGDCPIADWCLAFQQNRTDELPIKKEKKPRRIEEKTVFLLQCGDKIAVRKRMEKGLLSGLWEYPNTEGCLSKIEAEKYLKAQGIVLEKITALGKARHVFTHVEWHMIGYLVLCRKEYKDTVWVTSKQIEQEISLPSAFRHFKV